MSMSHHVLQETTREMQDNEAFCFHQIHQLLSWKLMGKEKFEFSVGRCEKGNTNIQENFFAFGKELTDALECDAFKDFSMDA